MKILFIIFLLILNGYFLAPSEAAFLIPWAKKLWFFNADKDEDNSSTSPQPVSFEKDSELSENREEKNPQVYFGENPNTPEEVKRILEEQSKEIQTQIAREKVSNSEQSESESSVIDTSQFVTSGSGGICSRTIGVQIGILVAVGKTNCLEVTERDLLSIKTLDLSYYSAKENNLEEPKITELKSGDFQGLSNLEELDLTGSRRKNGFTYALGNNAIESFPPGIFNGLVNLKNLYIGGNKLKSLPPGIFQGLSNLEWLSIWRNDIAIFPPDIFRGLSNLKLLDIENNKFKSLPPDIFRELSRLERLFLSSYNLKNLPPNIFQGLAALERLEISGAKLKLLPESIFQGLGRLKELDISHTWRITSLPEGIFQGLNRLERLKLQYMQLNSMPEGIFQGLSNLNTLLIGCNKFNSMPEGIFQGLSNLYKLSIGGKIQTLPPEIFKNLGELRYIWLDAEVFNDLLRIPALSSCGQKPICQPEQCPNWWHRLDDGVIPRDWTIHRP